MALPGHLQSIAGHIGTLNSHIHGGKYNHFGPGGRFTTSNAVRGGLAFGLGAIAVRNAQDSYHKLKYGEIGGSMLSAAMGASAAAGAYHMATQSGALKNVLTISPARFSKWAAMASKTRV